MTESNSPVVSVVIPTYDHRDLVLGALSSVFAQTFRDYEVIVVNDGSPDDTREQLAPWVRQKRVRYIEQENRGQASARNRGWTEARGRYIAFLDDDDCWPPDKLAWQVACLEARAAEVLVYGGFTQIRPDGEHRSDGLPDRPSGECYDRFLLHNWIDSPGQTLIRRTALQAIGGFDSGIWGSDDWDLYLRLAAEGPFHYEKRTALLYRMHPKSASRNAVRHARNHLKVVRKHIGWKLPLLLRHQHEAGNYFVPNLLRAAHEARRRGEFGYGLKACGYALLFQPEVLARRRFIAAAIGNLLRR